MNATDVMLVALVLRANNTAYPLNKAKHWEAVDKLIRTANANSDAIEDDLMEFGWELLDAQHESAIKINTTQIGSFDAGEQFDVKVRFNTNGEVISGVSVRLIHNSPEL